MSLQKTRNRLGAEAFLILVAPIMCLGLLLGYTSRAHAGLIATFVDAWLPESQASPTGIGEFDFASTSVFVDPSLTEWIAWNNTADVVVADPGCSGGVCLGPPGFGVDDFIRLTVTNPAGSSLTIDIDQNSGGGVSFGPQNVIFGTAAAAPDARRTGFGNLNQIFDEAGVFDSIFTTPGSYIFDFSFQNVFATAASHPDTYLLISSVPEPGTLIFYLTVGVAFLLVHSRVGTRIPS